MEIVEVYCDLLLARFGLLTQMKELDDGIAEPVSSLIWVAPRLQSDVQELKSKKKTPTHKNRFNINKPIEMINMFFFVFVAGCCVVISELLTTKYGKQYAEFARTATGDHQVSDKLMHKLAVQAPPKLLVEKYLIEIAKNYNIEYEPDPQVMKEDLRSIGKSG